MLRHPEWKEGPDQLYDVCCTMDGYVPACLCELVANAEEVGSGSSNVKYPNPPSVECYYGDVEDRGSAIGVLIAFIMVLLFVALAITGGVIACYKGKVCCFAQPHHTVPMNSARAIEVPGSSRPPVAMATAMPITATNMPVATATVVSATATPGCAAHLPVATATAVGASGPCC